MVQVLYGEGNVDLEVEFGVLFYWIISDWYNLLFYKFMWEDYDDIFGKFFC